MARHGAGARRRAADRLRRPSGNADPIERGLGRSPGGVRDARLVRLHAGAIPCRAARLAAGAGQPVLGGGRAVLAAAGRAGDVGDACCGVQREGVRGLCVRRSRARPDGLCRFAWLGARFGSVRTSLVLYVAPIASALLSWVILGEPPKLIHLVGGLLILGGVWASLRK
ncbi:EamA family transporter [Bradyrhizobium tropiciagri]|uniref:EamA family transporter n=1 Tax=Bradyrhizobium tropiciagri TaxID=312253 RepID=UPI001FCD3A6C|nr:EamA family transporter [Bradyrhizobium tropiciagri]